MAVLATGPNSNLTQILTPVNNLQSAQFSQLRESAADVTALNVLQCHYGHVGGATEFFETMDGLHNDFDFGLSHYFLSHPERRQRIGAIHQLRSELNFPLGHTVELAIE
jgi:Zn-dependent protease with chaperone function